MLFSWDADYIYDYFHFGEVKGSSVTLNYSNEISSERTFKCATNIPEQDSLIDIYDIPR